MENNQNTPVHIIFLGADFYPKDFNDSKEGFYPQALNKIKELYDVKTTLDITYNRQGNSRVVFNKKLSDLQAPILVIGHGSPDFMGVGGSEEGVLAHDVSAQSLQLIIVEQFIKAGWKGNCIVLCTCQDEKEPLKYGLDLVESLKNNRTYFCDVNERPELGVYCPLGSITAQEFPIIIPPLKSLVFNCCGSTFWRR